MQLLRDVRQAVRSLSRTPAFTLVALATLAIGIGGSSTVFTFVSAMFAASAPPQDLDRLAALWSQHRDGAGERTVVSPRDFVAWRERATSFQSIGAWRRAAFNLAGIDRPVRVSAQEATAQLLDVTGTHVLIGRLIATGDEQPGAARVVLLGHRFWQDRFGGDPGVLGRTVRLDGDPAAVIGVLAQRPLSPDVIVPLRLDPAAGARSERSLFVFARLAPGATLVQAAAEMDELSRGLEKERPDTNRGWRVEIRPLAEEYIGRNARTVFALLAAAVVAVLLIGCANIANLLVARGLARQRDLAIRSALGASRSGLIQQLLVESAALAAGGGAAGILVTHAGLSWLRASMEVTSTVLAETGLGWRVLIFAAGFSALATLAFGLVPALQITRPDLDRTLREGSNRATGGRATSRLRWTLVTGEVFLSVALLVTAGLLVRTLLALQSVEPGFEAAGVITARVTLPETGATSAAEPASFVERTLTALHADPQVAVASAGSRVPAAGSRFNPNRSLVIDGQAASAEGGAFALDLTVAPAYFRVLGIPLLSGRDFADRDRRGAPLVAVVNQALVRRYLGDGLALGRRLRLGDEDEPGAWRTIVGVVGDVRNDDIDAPPVAHVYVPHAQRPERSMTILARTREGDPAALVPAVREAVRRADPDLPLYDVKTMEQVVREDLVDTRVLVGTLALFALSALLLAAVGIGGVLAQLVSQRVPEIGIRMALGATAGRIVRMILGHALAAVAAGVVLGLAAATAIGRVMAGLLYQVHPLDATTYLGGVAVLLLAATLAAIVPVVRATRVDPLVALRTE